MAATNNNPSQQTRTGPHDTWQARNPSLTLMRSTPIHQHSTPTDHSNQTEEHHITSFDAGSFFNLHDYDSSNTWTAEDLLKTYGLKDDSTRHIPQAEKDKAVAEVIKIFDRDLSGTISFAEYTVGAAQGLKLPDFGFGPGHHGDDEYEYEIHHFEKYHDENTKEEDLIHPEDIEHFRKHDLLDEQQERQARMDKQPIVESNIPSKFRRNG